MVAMRWMGLVVCGLGVGGQAMAAGPCAPTPAAALIAARTPPTAVPAEVHGYRVEAVRRDPLLRQSWAVVRSCDHAERPSITLLTDLPASPGIAATPVSSSDLNIAAARVEMGPAVVRAGDVVRVWKLDARTHIELMATAEENGGVGTRVRVRLPAPKDAEGQVTGQPQYMAGIVRGPADVEMER